MTSTPFPTLTPNTKFAFRLGSAITIAGAFLFAGWSSANILRDIRDELGALRKDVRSQWSLRDMQDYSVEVERMNADLKLPDARRIHRQNQSAQDR